MNINQKDMNQLTTYIENQIKEIDFGKVTIEIIGTSDKVDVVTEERRRIFLTNKKST